MIPLLVFLGIRSTAGQALPKFMGRDITINKPETTDDGFPKGPASVCVEGPPQRQCYTAPKEHGLSPTVTVVQLEKGAAAILFSASSGGVSGWGIHFALLRRGTGKDLENLFFGPVSVSNQSQYTFLKDSAISDAPIFIVADGVGGPDEGPHSEHRFIISAYSRRFPPVSYDSSYYLADQYMTIRKYDSEANVDIIGSEKEEILARLRRVKALRPN